jgi:hypothetical protein
MAVGHGGGGRQRCIGGHLRGRRVARGGDGGWPLGEMDKEGEGVGFGEGLFCPGLTAAAQEGRSGSGMGEPLIKARRVSTSFSGGNVSHAYHLEGVYSIALMSFIRS